MLITTAPHMNHGQENTGRQESVWRERPEGAPNGLDFNKNPNDVQRRKLWRKGGMDPPGEDD